ncbi:MAG: tetratricopeptide repeat protein [Candidatus Omnitrophica bacterium]|nr:tetratricopeptide repeat protein [Candidatus Omnitrophota bacterium]
MSRFSNLEFDQKSEGERQSSVTIKDEAFYLGQAQQFLENGEFEHALRAYAKVLEFNPENATAWTGQVRMLIELEEFREARLWADKALEKFPHEAELLAAKAVALGRLGDLAEAMAFSDAAIEERGDTPYIWLARGDVLLARAEKRADYCFERAHTIEPQSWFWHWLGSRIRFYYRQFALSLKWAQSALNLDTSQGVVWLQLGYCQQALGLTGRARQSFEQARQLRPGCDAADAALLQLECGGLWGRLAGWWRRHFSG